MREAIDRLDRGDVRIAERVGDDVVVHQWLKQAILLLFRLTDMETMELGPFEYRDKIPLKRDYEKAGVRVVPGASARWGAHLEPGVIMMPSYVNIGARVGADTMVDTWATVGSCAQIGARVHLSGGVGIGGVLEPPGAVPIMVGDDAFIGSRCMVVDGARIGNGAVLGAGVILSGSIPVIDAETGEEISRGDRARLVRRGRRDPAPHLPRRRVRHAVCAHHQAPHRGRTPRQGRAQRRAALHRHHDVIDLLALTEELCSVPSVSLEEAALAGLVEQRLRDRAPRLAIERVGDNVIARTQFGREQRVVLGGHLDTVPPNGNQVPRRDGDTLHGLGTADMKGGLAIQLAIAEALAAQPDAARFDVTLIFYVGEEIAEAHNGLRALFADRPDLVEADLAILLEPTDAWVEAGCQGTLHLRGVYRGQRAHTARPWMGENAIHAAGAALARIAAAAPDPVDVDGLPYRQALQAVRVDGGHANNVVPDDCAIVVNRRFAPSVSIEEATAETRALLAGAAEIEVLNISPAAPPNLSNPLIAELVGSFDLGVRPKLGWTDVARFAAAGIPALNFGPGDPEISHTAAEAVTRQSLESCHAVLARFIGVD